MSLETLFTLYARMPRGGPGSDDWTREALRQLPALPPSPRVLDLGCGPGQQTRVLARNLKTRITAIDTHVPFLERLNNSARREGLEASIETQPWDMAHLPVAPGSVDLIWSEGAAYVLGFESALRCWRPLLKPDGCMAISECTWLTPSPDDELREYWQAAYPSMGTVDENRARALSAGLEVLDTLLLPTAAWWDNYYTPLQGEVARLRPGADADMAGVLEETEREIALFERYHTEYGYVFYILKSQAVGGA